MLGALAARMMGETYCEYVYELQLHTEEPPVRRPAVEE